MPHCRVPKNFRGFLVVPGRGVLKPGMTLDASWRVQYPWLELVPDSESEVLEETDPAEVLSKIPVQNGVVWPEPTEANGPPVDDPPPQSSLEENLPAEEGLPPEGGVVASELTVHEVPTAREPLSVDDVVVPPQAPPVAAAVPEAAAKKGRSRASSSRQSKGSRNKRHLAVVTHFF